MTSHEYIKYLTQNITPEYRYDYKEELSVWQERAKAKLSELLGIDGMVKPEDEKLSVKEEYEKNGLLYKKFVFQSEEGYFVPCCMVRKVELVEKAPICICLQGHSTGMHISLGEVIFDGDDALIAGGRDFAVRAAKEGMVAIAIEQRYMGKKGYNTERPEPGCSACVADKYANQSMAALLVGRTAVGERVWDIIRTIDVASKYFSDIADIEKIICMGNSGGGTASFYASSLDDRITVSVPSCGVCTYEESIMAMNHCPCNFVPDIRKYFNMSDIGALIAPRKLVLVCGRYDDIFPLEGVKKSFEAIKDVYSYIKNEKSCEFVIGNGGHQFYPDDAWPVIHKMLN